VKNISSQPGQDLDNSCPFIDDFAHIKGSYRLYWSGGEGRQSEKKADRDYGLRLGGQGQGHSIQTEEWIATLITRLSRVFCRRD